MSDIAASVIDWIKENSSQGGLQSSEISVDTDLIENGLLDSIDLINLVAYLEDVYGFSLSPDDLVPESFMNVKAITNLVNKSTA